MNYELIKVCGMREPENIRAVEELGVDYIGFIFWPQSSRYVAAPPAYLPTRARRVGVFVDAPIEEIVSRTKLFGLDAVQLHGHETPAFACQLREQLATTRDGSPPLIIKAISVATAADLATATDYADVVDTFLFDTRTTLPGGSGQQFDWYVISAYDLPRPFLLSGGIGPDDADRLRRFIHPRCIGLDLNSRFESAPAIKDINSLNAFIRKIKEQWSNHL